MFAAGGGRDKDGKKKRKDETDVLAALDGFRGKLKDLHPPSSSGLGKDKDPDDMDVDDEPNEDATAEGLEVDTDRGFLSHLLSFPKDNSEEVDKAEREYEVIDPRQRGARAKQEERDKRNAARGRGGRGRR